MTVETKGLRLSSQDRKRVQVALEAIKLEGEEECELLEQYKEEGDELAVKVREGILNKQSGMISFGEWVLGEEGTYNGRQLAEGNGSWSMIEGFIAKGRLKLSKVSSLMSRYSGLLGEQK